MLIFWGLTVGAMRPKPAHRPVRANTYESLKIWHHIFIRPLAQVFFVKKVRCVEKCRRIYHAKMFLIIKINAKVLQTNTNQTKTADEKTRELLCLLPQKITENLLQNKLQRPSSYKEPPNINTPPDRRKYCCVSANWEIEIRQIEIKIKFHMKCAKK
jgi:hypothetical protein